jgi:hypothetical protein
LCEGLASNNLLRLQQQFGATATPSNLDRYTGRYADRLVGNTILDFDDVSALSQNDAWQWVGYCPGSNVTYDRLQIAPEREQNYFFIDDALIDTQTCTGVNWDEGCIQFENVVTGEDEIIKVRPDRQCSEWLFCEEYDQQGRCTAYTACSEVQNGQCVRYGSITDPVRYSTPNVGGTEITTSTLQRVNMQSYQSRFGTQEGFRINRWRLGEYSGYTIPNLPPLEQLHDGVLVNRLASSSQAQFDSVSVTPEFTSLEGSFAVTEAGVDTWGINSADSPVASQLAVLCRGYREADAPYPSVLARLVPGFEGVNIILAQTGAEVPFNWRANICSYVKYTINNKSFYYTDRPTGLCVTGDRVGRVCSVSSECYNNQQAAGASLPGTTGSINVADANACLTGGALENALTGTLSGTDTKEPEALSEQRLSGQLGVCLEEDALFKATGGFLDQLGNIGQLEEGELDNNRSPNTCLTFFPR